MRGFWLQKSGKSSQCLHNFLVSIFICLMSTQLTGCVSSVSLYETQPAQELQWPGPTSGPRIVWLKTISGYQDVGITKGFWKKTLEFFVGQTESRIVRPHGLLFDAAERLYIADPGGGVVHCMDTREGRYTLIGASGDKRLQTPIGLTNDNRGRLYITDSQAKAVFRYDPVDGSLQTFLTGIFSRPTGIAYNPGNGLLYIVDTGAQQVLVFDLEGRQQLSFGAAGEGDGQFNFPTDITVDSRQRIYVTDALNYKIKIFSAAGEQLGVFGSAGEGSGYLKRPKGLAVDSEGHIYVVDSLHDAIQIFDETGRLLLTFGRQGSGNGEFRMPSGIFVDKRNYLYVADTYNQRIQIFRYEAGALNKLPTK